MGRRDLYDSEGKVRKSLSTLNQWAFSHRNEEIIRDFHERVFVENLTPARIAIYLDRFKRICPIIRKDLDKMDDSDLRRLIMTLRTDGLNDHSINFHITTLKKLSNFHKSLSFMKDFSFKVRAKKFDKHIPSREEVLRMIELCENIRDKAFIGCLYEGCFRPGDIMSIRKKDVFFDQYGARLIPDGKTDEYVGRIIEFSHYLADYFSTKLQHLGDDEYIWINLCGKCKGKPTLHATMNKVVKIAARRAGLGNKKICMYSFRHARNTYLLKKGYSSTFVNKVSGRKATSKQIEHYEHLSTRDIDDEYLKRNGLKPVDDDNENMRKCPRCTTINPPECSFCMRCGMVLDLKVAHDMVEMKDKEERIMDSILSDPEVMQLLKKKALEKGLSH